MTDRHFLIQNLQGGTTLGVYTGDTLADALCALEADAGPVDTELLTCTELSEVRIGPILTYGLPCEVVEDLYGLDPSVIGAKGYIVPTLRTWRCCLEIHGDWAWGDYSSGMVDLDYGANDGSLIELRVRH